MECFAHAGAAAIGVCRSCGKGICRECARDLGFALACSERCAKATSESEALTLRAKKAWSVGDRKRKPNVGLIMFLVFGLLFVGFGSYNTFVRNELDLLGLGMGSAFLVLSLIVYLQVRDIFKNEQNGKVS